MKGLMMDDLEAIHYCRSGEHEAFRHLVSRYQAQAIGHATAILGNREDALDAVQEAFMDAFQSLDRFDMSRRFYPWLYVILRNRCFKLIAGRRSREAASLDETVVLAPQADRSPEEILHLERALMELSVEDREIITLKHLDGLSYEEIAARLEIPRGTVMSRLYHARRRLRDRLSGVQQ